VAEPGSSGSGGAVCVPPPEPPGLLVPDWGAPAGVRAAFTLRGGGCSAPPCDSFNLALHVGDAPVAVAANRDRLRRALDLAAEPVWLQQVHGAQVYDADGAAALRDGASPGGVGAGEPPVADAAVTRRSGVVLAIMVADCLPVLFCSADGRRLGAAHAGWRGLAAGVLERTIEAMGVPPGELRAWIGPAIGAARFEIGGEVREALLAGGWGDDDSALGSFQPNPAGRWQCDLVALARLRLARQGVGSIAGGGRCTASDRSRFFSHRRDGRTGRMAALVWRESPDRAPPPVRI
jgi:YfiH family protein